MQLYTKNVDNYDRKETTFTGKQWMSLLHDIQSGYAKDALCARAGMDCTPEIDTLLDYSESIRRNVLSVRCRDYWERALSSYAYDRVQSMVSNDEMPHIVVLLYLYACAIILDPSTEILVATSEWLEEKMYAIQTLADSERDFAVTGRNDLITFYYHFNERKFLEQLNSAEVGSSARDALQNTLKYMYDEILYSCVPDTTLDDISKALPGLKEYDETSVAEVYGMCIYLMQHNTRKSIQSIYHEHFRGEGCSKYLQFHQWKPKDRTVNRCAVSESFKNEHIAQAFLPDDSPFKKPTYRE